MQVPDRQELVKRADRLARRIANFVRPKPRNILLTVEQVLAVEGKQIEVGQCLIAFKK